MKEFVMCGSCPSTGRRRRESSTVSPLPPGRSCMAGSLRAVASSAERHEWRVATQDAGDDVIGSQRVGRRARVKMWTCRVVTPGFSLDCFCTPSRPSGTVSLSEGGASCVVVLTCAVRTSSCTGRTATRETRPIHCARPGASWRVVGRADDGAREHARKYLSQSHSIGRRSSFVLMVGCHPRGRPSAAWHAQGSQARG